MSKTKTQYKICQWGNGTYSVHKITRTWAKPTNIWEFFFRPYSDSAKKIYGGIPTHEDARKIMMKDIQKSDPERPIGVTVYREDGRLHESEMPM